MIRGKTFIISGPSGVGKSTVLNALLKEYPDLYFSVSATTREPREGELDGIHYHFIEPENFHKMIEEDAFLEYAEFVDAAMDQGRDVILDIEIQGAQQVCAKRPETVRIFIAPPSWAELERRLTDRGTDDEDKVQKRLLRAKVELKMADRYDYFVVNDTVDNAVFQLKSILCAEHCKSVDRIEKLLVE